MIMGIYTYIQSDKAKISLYLGKFEEDDIDFTKGICKDLVNFCEEENDIGETLDEVKNKKIDEIRTGHLVKMIRLLENLDFMLPYDFHDIEYYYKIQLFKQLYPDAKIVNDCSYDYKSGYREIE